MLKHCIFCEKPFTQNDDIEAFRVGARIAFDPERGRLWSVCAHCHGWTLAPFEQRWEALEELERAARDRGRLLIQGENVALLRTGEVELVRIGQARLREEAWWRYGRELARRHARAAGVIRRGKLLEALWHMLILGVPFWTDSAKWLQKDWHKQFGRHAPIGQKRCTRCGAHIDIMAYTHHHHVLLENVGSAPLLHAPCLECHGLDAIMIGGPEAALTLRRLLAFRNWGGATQTEVNSAAEVIDQAGSPARLLFQLQPGPFRLGELDRTSALGLEIALNDEIERRALEGTVRDLEADWRTAEEIARIADSELT